MTQGIRDTNVNHTSKKFPTIIQHVMDEDITNDLPQKVDFFLLFLSVASVILISMLQKKFQPVI